MSKLLNYDEASDFLNIKKQTLYVLVLQNRIPHVKLGRRFIRFSQQDLIEWVNSKKKLVLS